MKGKNDKAGFVKLYGHSVVGVKCRVIQNRLSYIRPLSIKLDNEYSLSFRCYNNYNHGMTTTSTVAFAGNWIDPYNNPRKAPPSISGENVYVTWQTNNTANNNEEVIFRASTDGGITFGDKINLSNSTNSDSWKVGIDSDADSVVVTWWETNQTSDTPVMRVSADNGATFGPMLMLATNGTIDEATGEE